MCGIAFLHDPRGGPDAAGRRMADCLAAMRHRGPDDGRLVATGGAVLGHRRLSIIDLAGSPQPMPDPSGRYTLAYNGEIYNYAEVRQNLEPRWTFTSHGDTEVMLAGLILEGADFLDRLEGMWAFALWDAHDRSLLLGRDRMGKKPLFVVPLPANGLACASEIPALRRLTDMAWHEDADTVADVLRYGYPMPGHTAWREVTEILPGHVGRWRPGTPLAQQAWWSLRVRAFGAAPAAARDALREAMIAAVRRRMVADVEVGAFLSGGIDSTLVCSIIRNELHLPLKSFTIGFAEAAFDERRFARIAADALGTDHYEEVLTGWDEGELERLLLEHVGQPFADSSLLPTALVSQVAARHVKVALSGDGGDELFSGYQRYQARNILRWYSRLPAGLRHLAERAVRALPEPTAHHSRSVLKKAHLFLDIVGRQQAETPYFAPLLLAPAQLRQLAPDLVARGHTPPGIPPQTEPDDIARMMLADALIYLPQDILVKVDRASMAHSLETRAPFLDREVVELAFALPRHWHRRGVHGKRLLRETFGNLLPASLWRRRKQGFGVPIHAWFRGPLGDRLLTLARQDTTGPLRPAAIAALLAEHRHGKRDHGHRLWVLYTYLLWKRQHT
jgi:asparagine synthase (glutamine-hydrolysing)